MPNGSPVQSTGCVIQINRFVMRHFMLSNKKEGKGENPRWPRVEYAVEPRKSQTKL